MTSPFKLPVIIPRLLSPGAGRVTGPAPIHAVEEPRSHPVGAQIRGGGLCMAGCAVHRPLTPSDSRKSRRDVCPAAPCQMTSHVPDASCPSTWDPDVQARCTSTPGRSHGTTDTSLSQAREATGIRGRGHCAVASLGLTDRLPAARARAGTQPPTTVTPEGTRRGAARGGHSRP